MANKIKTIIVGDAGVGKTCFLKKHLTGNFTKTYHATIGVELHFLEFKKSGEMAPDIEFICWDLAGDPSFVGLGIPGYGLGAKAAIVMFDLSSKTSFKHVQAYINLVKETCGDIPIVICGNKHDEKRAVSNAAIYEAFITKGYQYYDISCKTNYNFEKPFTYLASKLSL